MADIKLLGLRISVYTRIARLALEEKGIPYDFEEVDIFADDGVPDRYLALNLATGELTDDELAGQTEALQQNNIQSRNSGELLQFDRTLLTIDDTGVAGWISAAASNEE